MQDLLKNLSRDLVNVAAGIMNKTNIQESVELDEANKENKAKSSAFRAGKKAHAAADMPNKQSYRGRWTSAEEKKKNNAEVSSKKDAAKDKAAKMQLAAKDRLRALGKSTKGAITPFNKGKEVAKAGPTTTHSVDKKIDHNVSSKEYDSPKNKSNKYFAGSGEGRGRFRQLHDVRQHDVIKRKIEDLHDNIRRKLDDMRPNYRATEQEGSGAIDKAKAHLEKMTKIHATLHESTDIEDFTDVIDETLELVETVLVLSELYGEDDNG